MNKPRLREETRPNDGMGRKLDGFEVSGPLTPSPGSLHSTLQKAVEAGFIEEGGCLPVLLSRICFQVGGGVESEPAFRTLLASLPVCRVSHDML